MEGDCGKNKNPCPMLPGTVLRIFIPAGAVINLFNFFEISSPSGICIVVRLPFLGGKCSGNDFWKFMNSVREAGGKIEFVNH